MLKVVLAMLGCILKARASRMVMFTTAAIAMALPASAAVVLKTNSKGLLLGASGVVIGTKTYNVDFVDGTCVQIFGACAVNKFDFNTNATAKAAANALFKQVLTGTYATYNAGNINGCASSVCDIFIPYAVYDSITAEAIDAANRGSGPGQFTGVVYPDFNTSTTLDSTVTYAKFTLQVAAAIPEPASWAMMIAGFGLTGGALRRRKVTVSIA